MSNSMFKCDHCGVAMSGPENYQQHLSGRKHLKALKAAGISVSDSVTSSTNEPAEDNSGKIVKPSVGTANLGKQRDLIPSIQTDRTQGNTDTVMNAVKAQLLSALPQKRVVKDHKCEVCNLNYSSKSHEEQHLLGKKHKQKIQTKARQCIKSASLYCGFCNLQINSMEQMDQHRSGTAHKDKVESARLLQQGIPAVAKCNTDPVMNAVKDHFLSMLPQKRAANDRKCEVCNLNYTSITHEDEHLSGKKHKQNVLTQEATTSDTLYCGLCHLEVNSIEQMDQHKSGTAHKDKVESARLLQQRMPVVVKCNTDPIMNAVKAHFLSTLPQKRAANDHKCEVCNLNYTSICHEEEHLAGKKHKQKVLTQEATTSDTLYCGLCNLHVNSIEQMNQHRSGTAHNMMIGARQTEQEVPHSADESGGTETSEATTSGTLYCRFCKLQVNSIEQMDQHRTGKTHHKNVARARLTEQGMPHSAAKKKFVPSSGTETFVSVELIPPPVPPHELLQI